MKVMSKKGNHDKNTYEIRKYFVHLDCNHQHDNYLFFFSLSLIATKNLKWLFLNFFQPN